MKKHLQHKSDTKLPLDRRRATFRVPVSLDHCSEKKYKRAERKFLNYAIEQGVIESWELPLTN